jgi:hypothetical protein
MPDLFMVSEAPDSPGNFTRPAGPACGWQNDVMRPPRRSAKPVRLARWKACAACSAAFSSCGLGELPSSAMGGPLRRSLSLTWSCPGRPIDEIDFRLTADGKGAVVELEDRSDDKTEWWLGAGSGWEHALIWLTVLLSGDDPSRVSSDELDQKLGPLWRAAGRACA